ncbi:hypothetical protein AN393_00887 [Pseudoalteromonas sp. P1-25]|nr:hypothetical protein AN393_00887 [Pseudoalteromonas sp. P1-25]
MQRFYKHSFLVLGLLGSAAFIWDGLYIGMFANDDVLATYPWGTELGWSYESKSNYMVKGFILGFLFWLPYVGIKLYEKHGT